MKMEITAGDDFAVSQTIVSRVELVARMLVAMLLTGLLSSFLFTLVITFLSVPAWKNPLGALFAVAMVGSFGSLVALPCAITLGLFVEWPLVQWHRNRGPLQFGTHVVVSWVAAVVVLLLYTENTGILAVSLATFQEFVTTLPQLLFMAFCGGLCSALFWHWLVLNRLRSVAPEGVT